MKALKIFLILLLSVWVLLLAAITGGFLYIQSSDQSERLGQLISDATGMNVQFPQGVDIELLPVMKISAPKFEVKAFRGREPLFQADDLYVEINPEFLALFQIHFEKISMSTPRVYLHKDENGNVNWLNPRKRRGSSFSFGPISRLGTITLNNGTIVYQDDQADREETIQDVTVSINSPTMRSTQLALTGRHGDTPVELNMDTNLASLNTLPLVLQAKYGESALELDGTATGALRSDPSYSGELLAITAVPITLENGTIPPSSLNATVTLSKNAVNLSNMLLKYGKDFEEVTGTFGYQKAVGNEPQKLTIDLVTQGLDITGSPLCNKKLEAPIDGSGKDAPWSDKMLDLTFFQTTALQLKLAAARLQCQDVPVRHLEAEINSKAGVVKVEKLNLSVGQTGTVGVNGRLDVGTPVRGEVELNVSDFPFEMLLPDKKKHYVEMPLEGKAVLAFKGNSIQEWVDSLVGQFAFQSTRGRIVGLSFTNLEKMFNFFIKNKEEEERRPVRQFYVAATVEKGIVETTRLLLNVGRTKVEGVGKVDLGKWAINYRLSPRVKKIETTIVPILIKGSLSDPSITPDVKSPQGVGAAAGAAIGGPVGAAAGAAIGGVVEGILGEKLPEAPPVVEEDPVKEKKTPGLPFNLMDRETLDENVLEFLESGE